MSKSYRDRFTTFLPLLANPQWNIWFRHVFQNIVKKMWNFIWRWRWRWRWHWRWSWRWRWGSFCNFSELVAATLRYGVRGGCAAALSRYRGHRRDENAGYNNCCHVSGGTGGSGKGKSSMRDNSFRGGSWEDPQQYVEGKNKHTNNNREQNTNGNYFLTVPAILFF